MAGHKNALDAGCFKAGAIELGLQIAAQEALKHRLHRHQGALAIGPDQRRLELAALLGAEQHAAGLIEQLRVSGANADCGAGVALSSGGFRRWRQRQFGCGACECCQLLQQRGYGFIAGGHHQLEQGTTV